MLRTIMMSCRHKGAVLAVLRLVGLSVLAAAVLEVLTLVGARTASPFVLGEWSLRRMAVFWALALVVGAYCMLGVRCGALRSPRQVLCSLRRPSPREVVLPLVLAVASGMVAELALVGLLGLTFDLRYGAIAAIVVLVGYVLVRYRALWATRLEWGFLVVALSFGTLFCVCMPVPAEISWDGQIHFRNAVAVSYVRNAEYTEADVLMMRADAVEVLDLIDSGSIAGIWNPKQDAESILSANEQILAAEATGSLVREEGTTTWAGSSYVSPSAVGYIPNALGLWLGRLFGLTSLGQYLLARWTSVVCYCLVLFCAIRRLRSGKALVAVLGLLPSPLLMAANFSYDPWCYMFVTYAFASYVGALQREGGLRPFDMARVCGAFFLGALVKAVLFPLALVFFVAPRRCLPNVRMRRAWRGVVVLTVVALLLSFALPFVFSGAEGGDTRGGSEVSSAGQVAFILSDPVGYAGIFLSFCASFFNPVNSTGFLNVFTAFPYLAAEEWRVVPTEVVVGILLVASVLFDREPKASPVRWWGTRAAVVVGSASAFLLVATALYVSFTPVGLDTINGVQYRYLLGFLAPVFLVGCNLGFRAPRQVPFLPCLVLAGEYVAMLMTVFLMFVVRF